MSLFSAVVLYWLGGWHANNALREEAARLTQEICELQIEDSTPYPEWREPPLTAAQEVALRPYIESDNAKYKAWEAEKKAQKPSTGPGFSWEDLHLLSPPTRDEKISEFYHQLWEEEQARRAEKHREMQNAIKRKQARLAAIAFLLK